MKQFGYLIFYCISNDGKIVERIYIFPRTEIICRSCITIVKNNSRGPGWYEQYRIKDEKIVNKVNEIWQKIIQM